MSTISFNSSIRTSKVYTGDAIRMQSDRFQNHNNMICIPWDTKNSKGQTVCHNSFYTKTPGCHSALDRVHVENHHRPNYGRVSDEKTYMTIGAFGHQISATIKPIHL